MRTRFAPSPTGSLHIGNIYSAYFCQHWAQQNDAEIILRIEDIDSTRCRTHFSEALLTDLKWLGLKWHGDVLYQQTRMQAYKQALLHLQTLELVYPCTCTRAQIKQSCEHATIIYPEADPYQGTCRHKLFATAEQPVAWRLNTHQAMRYLDQPLYWTDTMGEQHQVHAEEHGDVIVARKDIGVSYHLAVVVDDAYQKISHVIRGKDLQAFTGIHCLLQALLTLPSPHYLHHPLLYAPNQQKWSKRNKAPSLQDWRVQGWTAQQVRQYVRSLGGFDEH